MPGQPAGQVRVFRVHPLAYAPGSRGFHEYFQGEIDRFWANFDLRGNSLDRSGQWVETKGSYRIDTKTEAALAFLKRNKASPFFLYVAYMAPHTPLAAPKRYLDFVSWSDA